MGTGLDYGHRKNITLTGINDGVQKLGFGEYGPQMRSITVIYLSSSQGINRKNH
jgi:hypothetical protein